MPQSDSVVLDRDLGPVDLWPGLAVANILTLRPWNQRFGGHLVLLVIFLRAVKVRVEYEGEPTGGCLLIHRWKVVVDRIATWIEDRRRGR